jgi:hypothetical protein
MNNKLLLPLALLCSPVFAGPYVGLEVGAASMKESGKLILMLNSLLLNLFIFMR